MASPYDTQLPPHLRALKEEIEQYAREYGLDFYETIFEVVDAEDLNEIAAYGGFPTRYPHWSFGMSFEELKKGYDYGLSKIYEMVINNDPCYAYLMRSNHTIDQKLVMAHVYGHCLAPETLIETKDGVKPITEVKVGEKVLTHTGAFRPVRFVARRWYSGEIIRLQIEGSEQWIRITPEHPVYALRPVEAATVATAHIQEFGSSNRQSGVSLRPAEAFDFQWVPAGTLQVGDEVAIRENGELFYGYLAAVENKPYDGYVYNFSVEEDESYTLAAGMVVHNCDFFKNNAYFAHTSRKMMDEMANHGMRIRRYVEKYGEDEVEAFMDRCMSIDDLIDVHSTAIKRRGDPSKYNFEEEKEEEFRQTRFKSKGYMDSYINPPDVLKAEEEEQRQQKQQKERRFPEHPEKDVLLFLINYAPLKPWQRDVLSIIRDEAFYFAPQAQTKILNEGWACTVKGTLVFTELGLLPIEEVVENQLPCRLSDGESTPRVYDWAKFADRETVRIRTQRGLTLEGSRTHQILLPDGTWKRMDELQIGDTVTISGGQNLWAQEYVSLNWQPQRRTTLQDVASEAGVDIETVIRYRRGVRGRHAERLAPLVEEYDSGLATMTAMHNRRRPIQVPDVVDEKLGAILGYLVGDGHVSERKRVIGLTTGDDEQADRFAQLTNEVFDIEPRKKLDGNRWRVSFSSQMAVDFFKHLDMPTGVSARRKSVPDVILRSPKFVVAAFLQSYFDCDGYAGKAGVILSTASEKMSETVQILLLNFGILSRRRKQKDGCWHVHVTGQSTAVFAQEIGFGLARKMQALEKYVQEHVWFKAESWEDEIVAIEHRRADVYDISVEQTHRYAAQGFINHNSYWHSTIMTQRCLTDAELIDYADHHSGTMASSGRLNPYKLGIELLRDIEHRWNTGKFGKEYDECDDLETRRKWNKQLGLGRKKIFEVRRIYNDITFIDTFLTPEFCVKHKFFSFNYDDHAGQYFIESREFEMIKQRLLFSLTNFGKPWIYVVDGNYRNRGELLLRHEYNGIDLKLDWAAETLANIQHIWSRPVNLQTIVEDRPTLLTFDGSEHSMKTLGDADDPRKHDSDKPF